MKYLITERQYRLISEVRGGMINYLIDKGKEITGIDWPEYVIQDWMYKKTTKVKELLYMFNFFMDRYGKGRWVFQKLNLSLNSFTDEDQEILKRKMGGDINPQIPDDEVRHQRQQSQADKMGVSSEPIIVALNKEGKYDLIEGWHRTTTFLKKFGSYEQNAWVYVLE
jgi:hypothetical protein